MTIERCRVVTAKIELIPTDASMTEAILDVVMRSREEISIWMAWAANPTIEDERAFVEMAEEGWRRGVMWSFMIHVGGEIVGGVGLTRHGMSYLRRAELGYWMDTSWAGKGIATEAAAAAAHFGFEVLGMHRLELYASPENLASRRVAEKIGFLEEGEHRDATLGRDGFMDTISYGLLETDPRLIPEEIRFEQG